MKQNTDFVLRTIAGENILVPTGEAASAFNGMISMNEMASFIWNHIEEVKDKQELVALILEEYEIDEETVWRDVNGFVGVLIEKGLVRE